MCVLSIKVPIRKKSGNISYAPRICAQVHSCIHVHTPYIHSVCEVRRMYLKLGQRRASPDAGWKNFIRQDETIATHQQGWREVMKKSNQQKITKLYILAVKRIYVNKTNVIHKRLNFLRLHWFPRGWVVESWIGVWVSRVSIPASAI